MKREKSRRYGPGSIFTHPMDFDCFETLGKPMTNDVHQFSALENKKREYFSSSTRRFDELMSERSLDNNVSDASDHVTETSVKSGGGDVSNHVTETPCLIENNPKSKKSNTAGKRENKYAPAKGSIVKTLMDMQFGLTYDVTEEIVRNQVHVKNNMTTKKVSRIKNGLNCRTMQGIKDAITALKLMEESTQVELEKAIKQLFVKFNDVIKQCVLKTVKNAASIAPIRYDSIQSTVSDKAISNTNSKASNLNNIRKQLLSRYDVVRMHQAMIAIAKAECDYLDTLATKTCVLECPACDISVTKKKSS